MAKERDQFGTASTQLTEIRTARAALEKEEEAAIMELETQGVSVDRRPDETPETFLEWDGRSFNKAKLEDSTVHRYQNKPRFLT